MFQLNFKNIAAETSFPAVVRLLAHSLIDGSSYFTIEKWLKSLSTHDLQMLMELAEEVDDTPGNEVALMYVMLTEMLVTAEGGDHDEQQTPLRLNILVTFLSCESLFRKGIIEFDRTVCSFDDAQIKKVMAWPKGTQRPAEK